MTELDLALLVKDQGAKVVESAGRYWFSSPRGFYHPIHWLARMTKDEVRKPQALCWGFQSTLSAEDRGLANGTLPIHILSEIDNYDVSSLSPRRRTKLRKCHKRVEFVELLKPDLLLEQGYEVLASAHQRTGYGRLQSSQAFKRDVTIIFSQPRALVLGGLVNGALKGFLLSYAVGSTAYLRYFHISTEALGTNIGMGLVYELIQVVRRSENITELVNSPHTPEKASLSEHKIGMGFPIVHVPSFVWFAPMTEGVVKKLRPHAHYRLTGKVSGQEQQNVKDIDENAGLERELRTHM